MLDIRIQILARTRREQILVKTGHVQSRGRSMAQKNIRGERIPLPPNVVACERPGEPGAL